MPEFKPFDYGNVLATGEAIKGQRAQNALLQARTDAIPQEQKLRGIEMQLAEGQLSDRQKANAAGILANRFSAVAQSANPKAAAQQFLADPSFASAGQLLGLPIDQFTIGEQDTDESIRASATDWARALGSANQSSQQRVHSTFVGKNGNQWYISADGRTVDTGVPASQFAQRPVEAAGALVPFDPASGRAGAPIATAEQQVDAASNLKRAETEAVAGVIPADARATAAAKSPRLAAARRRLVRVAEASQALGSGGGPIEGRIRNIVGTPAAQELEAANAQLINELTALTRIPGVGSQSDLEQRLAQLQLPNATQHPSVRERSLMELDAFLTDLDAALNATGFNSSGGDSSAPQPAPGVINWADLQ